MNRFTPREIEVLELLAQGLANHEIAARLYLSTNTVKHHVRAVFNKIGVNTRTKAAVWYLSIREINS